MGLIMGIPSLQEIFEEKYYRDLNGGILEAFGKIFSKDLVIYAYPFRKDDEDGVATIKVWRCTRASGLFLITSSTTAECATLRTLIPRFSTFGAEKSYVRFDMAKKAGKPVFPPTWTPLSKKKAFLATVPSSQTPNPPYSAPNTAHELVCGRQ
jgi:hypothetical protein